MDSSDLIFEPAEQKDISLICGKALTGLKGDSRPALLRIKQRLEERLETKIDKYDKQVQAFIRSEDQQTDDAIMLNYIITYYVPLLLGWGPNNQQNGRLAAYIIFMHYNEDLFPGWTRLTVVDRAKKLFEYAAFLFKANDKKENTDESYIVRQYRQVHDKLRKCGVLEWDKESLELTLDKKYNLDEFDDAVRAVINDYYINKKDVTQEYIENRKEELIKYYHEQLIQSESITFTKKDVEKIESSKISWEEAEEINHILREKIGYNIQMVKKKYRIVNNLDDDIKEMIEFICSIIWSSDGHLLEAISKAMKDKRSAYEKFVGYMNHLKQKREEKEKRGKAW